MIFILIQVVLLISAVFILAWYLIINFATNRAAITSHISLPKIWNFIIPFNFIFILGIISFILIQLLFDLFPKS